jgi:undecaprenyldiphospho-muramoylpentapeptide beta-N-acetylglucosaminyltransferase
MRLLICAGGTGGGVYPALAVLKHLSDHSSETHASRRFAEVKNADLQLLWVGGESGMEVDLVKRAGIPYTAIPAAGVHGVGVRALPGNLWQLLRGLQDARRVLRTFMPDILFFTGGYVAVPVGLAARLFGRTKTRPAILLFIPDIEPGLALKTLVRFSDHIALTASASQRYLPAQARATVTGYPVRSDLQVWTRSAACQALQLRADLPVLSVLGGSTGARSINRALLKVLPDILEQVQVVHLSGKLGWAEVEAARAELTTAQSSRYRAFPYVHEEMGAVLAAADLALSRAGASTLGEFPLFSLPAVLVPYPYAWRYQQVNADYLAERGAAVVLNDSDLPDRLLPTIQALMGDKNRLDAMSQAMRSLARPDASQAIAGLLKGLLPISTVREYAHG